MEAVVTIGIATIGTIAITIATVIATSVHRRLRPCVYPHGTGTVLLAKAAEDRKQALIEDVLRQRAEAIKVLTMSNFSPDYVGPISPLIMGRNRVSRACPLI